MKYLLILILIITSFSISAQALSGNYTIGTGGNYTSITQAVDTLMAKGVSGPVVMNIQAGTYNESISIGNIVGASAINTITFQSANGDSTAVLITSTVQVGSTYTIYITENYINFNLLSVFLINSSSNAGFTFIVNAEHVNITNCIMSGGSLNYKCQAVLAIGNANNVLIKNNLFTGYADWAVRLYSNGTYGFNNTFTNNSIINNAFDGSNNYGDLYLYKQKSPIISHNILHRGNRVRMSHVEGNAIIKGNIFGGWIDMESYLGNANNHMLFYNNFILHKQRKYLYNSPTVLLWGDYIDFYNNSISDSSINLSSYVIQLKNSSHCNIQNNIFHDRAYGVLFFYDQGNSNIISNNNDYSTGGYYGKTANSGPSTSLSAWKTLSGMESNSISINPGFFSTIDLHISNPAMNGSGVSLSSVTDDFDGDLRPSNPDMGADESVFSLIDAGVIGLYYNSYHPDSVCGYTIIDSIRVRIKNYGINTINFTSDSMLLTLTISGPINSTYQTTITSGALLKDSVEEYLIAPSINILKSGNYNLNAILSIATDSNISNNNSSYVQIKNYKIVSFPYIQNFEGFNKSLLGFQDNSENDFQEGWWKSKNYYSTVYEDRYTYSVYQGAINSLYTGPSYDHTLMNANGKWIGSYTLNEKSTCKMWAPCIDFSNIQNPVLSFWYHMFGNQLVNDTLFVDVYNGTNWDLGIYSLGGPQQASKQAPWLNAIVSLGAYANSEITIRFRVKQDTNLWGVIAIDDIMIDALPQVALGNDTAICSGDTLTLGYAPSSGYTYQWKENLQGTIVGQGSYLDITQAGIYIYKATNSINMSAYDTIVVSVKPLPHPNLGTDTIICDTTSIVLSTQQAYLSYLWQNGSTNNSFTVNSTTGSGNYWVNVQDFNYCWNADTINVTLDTCLGIYDFEGEKLAFTIYPNPTKQFLFIQSHNVNGLNRIIIYDIQGREVFNKKCFTSKNGLIKLNVTMLKSGFYILVIQNKNKVYNTKLIFE